MFENLHAKVTARSASSGLQGEKETLMSKIILQNTSQYSNRDPYSHPR